LEEIQTDGRGQRRLENRARIYDAAMKLLRRRSYGELTVEEICDAAGVGRATFFRIFEAKTGLLREFNRRLAARVEGRLAAEAPTDAAGALRIVADEIVSTWSRAAPGATEMAIEYMHAAGPGQVHGAHPELLDLVVGIVEGGVKTGEIRGANPPLLTGALALTQLAAAAAYWIEHSASSLESLVEEALESWLHGALA
jgi:AcrR family transcriptional regulator